jgi:hypothetical protein
LLREIGNTVTTLFFIGVNPDVADVVRAVTDQGMCCAAGVKDLQGLLAR